MVVKLELQCSLHRTGIFSTTDTPSPAPRSQSDHSRPALSPSPPNSSPPVNPHADRIPSRGTDGSASHPLHGTPASSRRRSRSPLRRPLPASRSPPSRAHAPFSRTTLPESCLTIYHQVKNKVQDRRTVKEALSALNISERTWRRKQKIAELMILDRSRFDEIASRMVRDAGGSRLNQATLSDRCHQELRKSDIAQKRREAIIRLFAAPESTSGPQAVYRRPTSAQPALYRRPTGSLPAPDRHRDSIVVPLYLLRFLRNVMLKLMPWCQ